MVVQARGIGVFNVTTEEEEERQRTSDGWFICSEGLESRWIWICFWMWIELVYPSQDIFSARRYSILVLWQHVSRTHGLFVFWCRDDDGELGKTQPLGLELGSPRVKMEMQIDMVTSK